jgi:hypothetical protein
VSKLYHEEGVGQKEEGGKTFFGQDQQLNKEVASHFPPRTVVVDHVEA